MVCLIRVDIMFLCLYLLDKSTELRLNESLLPTLCDYASQRERKDCFILGFPSICFFSCSQFRQLVTHLMTLEMILLQYSSLQSHFKATIQGLCHYLT